MQATANKTYREKTRVVWVVVLVVENGGTDVVLEEDDELLDHVVFAEVGGARDVLFPSDAVMLSTCTFAELAAPDTDMRGGVSTCHVVFIGPRGC